MNSLRHVSPLIATLAAFGAFSSSAFAEIGLGAKPLAGAVVIIDGSRKTLDDKWTYWEGPRFGSSLPIKWKIVADPVDGGTVVQTDDPAATLGKYGAADIVTSKPTATFACISSFS